MSRVADAEVRAIIDVDSLLTDISPFITAANLIVTDKLASSGTSEEMLKEIERWLAAHFVAVRDPRSKSESIGGITAHYFVGREGEGLRSTPYGQQALALDLTGILAKAGMRGASIGIVNWSQE